MQTKPGFDPNQLVRAAVAGDRDALDRLMGYLRDDVYRLALRTLGHPADAEDAAQEALIQILTALATFRGEASVRTWAFRIAIRHYMRFRKGRYEMLVENFASIDQVIDAHTQRRRGKRCGTAEHPGTDAGQDRKGSGECGRSSGGGSGSDRG